MLREAASSRARRVSEDAQPPAKSTTPRKVRCGRFGHTAGPSDATPNRCFFGFPMLSASAFALVLASTSDPRPRTRSTHSAQMTMAELMREEEERYDEAEATKRDHAKHAQSLSGSGKDLGTLSNRRGSTARSGLPTHREDPTDDEDDDAIDTTQAKLWNEKELEHMMEDVAVRLTEVTTAPILQKKGCPQSKKTVSFFLKEVVFIASTFASNT